MIICGLPVHLGLALQTCHAIHCNYITEITASVLLATQLSIRVFRTCYTLVHFVHTVQMLHPYYPIRCGETRLIGIISGQSNQKQSKLRTSLPYMGRNIDCCGQNIPVCHASRKTLMQMSNELDLSSKS